MTDQLKVDFVAADDGTYPMTWGQRTIWKAISAYGDASSYFNIKLVVDLPADPAPGQAAVVEAVRRLVERNQALRTHFRDGPEGPVQQIEQSGTFIIRVFHSTLDSSRACAQAVAAELAAVSFRYDTEWAVRIALVCAGPVPRHAVFVVSHVTADGGGCQALIEDLLALLRASSDGSGPAADGSRPIRCCVSTPGAAPDGPRPRLSTGAVACSEFPRPCSTSCRFQPPSPDSSSCG